MLRGGPAQVDGSWIDAPPWLQAVEFPNMESGPQRSCVLRWSTHGGVTEDVDGEAVRVLFFDGA